MDTTFRQYLEEDYPDLTEMIFSLYREDPEGERMEEEKIKQTIAEYRKNPDKVRIYMFRNGDENIGYAILVYFWSNEFGGNIITVDGAVRKGRLQKPGNRHGILFICRKTRGQSGLADGNNAVQPEGMRLLQKIGFRPKREHPSDQTALIPDFAEKATFSYKNRKPIKQSPQTNPYTCLYYCYKICKSSYNTDFLKNLKGIWDQ